jgi:WD40 repeat protein
MEYNVVLLDAITGSSTSVLGGGRCKIGALAFSTNGTLHFSIDHSGAVKLWDVQTGGVVRSFIDGFLSLSEQFNFVSPHHFLFTRWLHNRLGTQAGSDSLVGCSDRDASFHQNRGFSGKNCQVLAYRPSMPYIAMVGRKCTAVGFRWLSDQTFLQRRGDRSCLRIKWNSFLLVRKTQCYCSRLRIRGRGVQV